MGIKAKASLLVNSLAGLAFLVLALPIATAAGVDDDARALPKSAPRVPSPADILPDIEARDFAVHIAKRSTSGKTYLLDDVSDSKTKVGKILLFRRDSQQVMAFRVVKTYEEKKQFAAKRVRRYGNIQQLDTGESYMALEKIGDVVIPPPTAQDKVDLKELESPTTAQPPVPTAPATQTPVTPPPGVDAAAGADGTPPPPPADSTTPPVPTAPAPDVRPFDADLDAASSPPQSGAVDSTNSKNGPHDEDDEDPQAHFGMTIDEINPLDPNTQWLTGGFGFFRNNGSDGNGAYFAGGGLRYAYSLGRMLALRRAHAQDSLAVELSAFYYKVLSYQTINDAYEILPLIGTLRYNIVFGENFGIFFYGGIMQNNVTKVSGGSEAGRAALSSIFPAAGAGLLFRVGPNWDARVDAGFDQVSLGLVLRF